MHPRIGVVLDPTGGALGKMLTPFRFGAGGPIGSGAQGFPWIARDDLVGMLHAMITDDAWSVPGTAKQPPPQKGLPNPMSDFIRGGKWREGYEASDNMLDEHARKYGLEDQDWRREKPWYKP